MTASTNRPRTDHRTILAGLIDHADRARPPHPGGRPCGGLCVPACTAKSVAATPTRGAQR